MKSFDQILAAIEQQCEEIATKAIAERIASHPDEKYYAAAFWLFYCDYKNIGPPCLAMNTESYLARPEAPAWGRWAPTEWQNNALEDTTERLSPLYEALSGEHDRATWDAIIDHHQQAIARVCKRITTLARNRTEVFQALPVVQEFVVGILEDRDGDEEFERLVRLSIEPAILEELNLPFE